MPSTIKRIREKWRAKGLTLPRSRSRTSSSSEDIGDSAETPEPPTISKLYGEAAEYEKVLASNGCIDGQATHHDGTNGLVDLVDRHLGQLEEAVTDHVARPFVEEWPSSDEVDVSGEEGVGVVPDGPKTERDTIVSTPVIRRPEVSIDDPWKLEPPKIIDLFVEEFGPLAADGEEENLVLETDGFLIHDVVIVGVIHLTTHRLAFHASLFDSQPDLPALKRVIKAGPATLHRKGWRTKRRVWLELSHDMLCAYPSSSDEGKDRPLDTILFIFINSLLPLDPLQPRYIHIELGIGTHKRVDDFEFDTEESARDWRRELEGALFLHRHRRREVINAILPEETGIRLSIPLNRIAHVRFGSYSDFPFTASLVVRSEHGDELDHPEQPTIHLGTITPSQVWTHLDGYIAAASRRLLEKRTGDDSPVFIDFGPLTFHERRAMPKEEMPRLKDMAIRGALNLDSDDAQLWIVPARIYRNISSSGYLVLSQHFVHFWSKSLTPADVKYRIPVLDIQSFKPFHVSFCRLHGITIDFKEKPSLKLLFRNASIADEAVERITALVNTAHSLASESPSTTLTRTVSWPSELSADSRSLRSHTRSATAVIAPLSRSLAAAVAVGIPPPVQLTFPKAINLPREIVAGLPPMHFVCLTIGSRGDVQPYIALGLGLKKEGHRVTIVTHEEYKMWIESFGIGHRTAGGDPAALMKLSVDHKMFSPDFFRESLGKFRPWLDQLLLQAWEACHDADVLLESPSAMAGVHIAEALSIPYFRTFTMPWTKSSEFPHPFLSPPVEAPAFNSASYILFNNVMWTATSGQINRWRRKVLNLHNTDMGHLAQSKIVTIYCFSQAVVPKPLDWGDTINISGYWFLDNPDLTWSPPQDLLDWMYKARMDGKPIVYIGFGSITVPHPNEVTSRIVRAVLKSDVRAVVAKGWSARRSDERDAAEVEIPPECYVVEKIPHDWLFPRVDAALHHGGAGTTGASLRAGIPTLIKPWFGDQYFWAQRVQKLGAGMRVGSLRVSDMADALTKATTNPAMKQKAAHVGEIIRSEDGVHSAIHTIYTYLPRAARKYDAGD
ncbi:putative glycosyltransferase family 28 N-terminal domain [Lyophyllum shimeji]|uniref:sterol 3beta-glucosyltransferase n=1 Tax=Lyophyllum shimeji TaxID=47721 RepID=A0A9P3PMQ1_LYOSH|nr:putative glycosyltransferase family 28 N-terminal domain [Lyophyllum shimeji]